MKIAFVYNLRENDSEDQAEWDSPDTIEAISRALSTRGRVVGINAGCGAAEKKIRTARPDIVFNYAEGASGEAREAEIPEICERIPVPYTGSGPEAMLNCLNKARAKSIMDSAGVPTAPFRVVESPGANLSDLNFPCIVKPAWEGSSIGIHNDALALDSSKALEICKRMIRRHSQPALVEEFLPGDEFTAGIIGNGSPAEVLPIVAVNHSALAGKLNPILSYEAKWVLDTPGNPLEILTCPARVEAGLYARLEDIALRAFRALNCRDWCRIDIRLDASGEPRVLELNPLPGLLPRPEDNSCFTAAARAAGLSYDEIIHRVLDCAMERLGMGSTA